jgi:hypothetical protein
MPSLDLRFRSAMSARRWRKLRRSTTGASALSLGPVSAAGAVVLIGSELEPGLAGIWRRDDRQLVRLHHVGREVRSFVLTPAEGAPGRLEIGGIDFVTTVSGQKLEGAILDVRQDEGATECPEIPRRSWEPIELRMIGDGDRLVGRWLRREWSYADCEVHSSWQDIAYERVRKPL